MNGPQPQFPGLRRYNNLSDVFDAASARSNIGLGTADYPVFGSVDCSNRMLHDSSMLDSIFWEQRQLCDSSGNKLVDWSSTFAVNNTITVIPVAGSIGLDMAAYADGSGGWLTNVYAIGGTTDSLNLYANSSGMVNFYSPVLVNVPMTMTGQNPLYFPGNPGYTTPQIVSDGDGGISIIDQGEYNLTWNQWDMYGLYVPGNIWFANSGNLYMNGGAILSVGSIQLSGVTITAWSDIGGGGSAVGADGNVQVSNGAGGFDDGTHPMNVDRTTGGATFGGDVKASWSGGANIVLADWPSAPGYGYGSIGTTQGQYGPLLIFGPSGGPDLLGSVPSGSTFDFRVNSNQKLVVTGHGIRVNGASDDGTTALQVNGGATFGADVGYAAGGRMQDDGVGGLLFNGSGTGINGAGHMVVSNTPAFTGSGLFTNFTIVGGIITAAS
jgi:hypothetical protein